MKIKYTTEHKNYLKSISHLPADEEINLLKEKFNIDITKGALYKLKERLGFNKYKKRTPYTKEQKKFLLNNAMNYDYKKVIGMFYKNFGMKLTKDHIYNFRKYYKLKRTNTWEIGEERRYGDNYYRVKTGNHKYISKQRYIYENKKMKSFENKRFVFLDKNKNNYNIENLLPLNNRQMLLMARKQLFFNDKDLLKTSVLLAELELKKIDISRCNYIKFVV